MSTSILDVWITNLGDPCSITNDAPPGPPKWVVAVAHCNGSVLNWSEGRYRFHRDDPWQKIAKHTIPLTSGGTGAGTAPGWWYDSVPTLDGHVEIEVPPGCYVLCGTMHTWFKDGELIGNWATDHAIVQACCGEDVCATLLAPTAWHCSIVLFDFVVPMLVKNKILTAEQGRAIAQVKEFFKPQAASSFEQRMIETLRGVHSAME